MQRMSMGRCWNDTDKIKPSTRRKSAHATLSITDLSWTDLELNPATNCLIQARPTPLKKEVKHCVLQFSAALTLLYGSA